jgi:hypothetical protein
MQSAYLRRLLGSLLSPVYGAMFSSTSSGSKEKTSGSRGSTVARTQCTSGLPKVSTLVKFKGRVPEMTGLSMRNVWLSP